MSSRLKSAFTALGSAAFLALSLGSCQDNVPQVGSQLATGEVKIALDSLVWDGTDQYIHRGNDSTLINVPKISFRTVRVDGIDSRSTTNLLGRLSVPEYGDLRCSFVSRLMCSKTLGIPDSIPLEQIDSMKLVLSVARGALTGDSLAPQQLKAYRLDKPLPKDIDNRFDPTGYYDPDQPIGSRSYTLSALGMSDSLYTKLSYINIEIPMSKQMAVETVKAYRDPQTAAIFQWPASFEQYFPGIFVEPSFGRGCVANIAATTFLIFYNYPQQETKTDSEGTTTVETVTKVGVTGVFETSPIVLNSNNITYNPSAALEALAAAGEPIITTPGGFRVKVDFPAKELIDIYRRSESNLSVVSDLNFIIPAEEIANDYGIVPPPYLALVKSSKLDDFLANNELPDGKTSFYATYDKTAGRYVFSSMRNYIIDLIQNGITDSDSEFTLVPVNLTLEKEDDGGSSSYYDPYAYYYGYGYGSSSSASYTVTKCTPYIAGPSMCRLQIDKARTIFTYTLQQMK